MLALLALLFSVEPALSHRLAWFRAPFTCLYTGLAVAVGLQQPYFDMWGVLFLPLSIYVVRSFERNVAAAWLGLEVALVMVILSLTLGLNGLTAGMMMVAGIAGAVSYDRLYSQAEAARASSHQLLTDLQEAHAKLVTHAGQAEELAAARERNRLARELHDAVNQDIFSITLHA